MAPPRTPLARRLRRFRPGAPLPRPRVHPARHRGHANGRPRVPRFDRGNAGRGPGVDADLVRPPEGLKPLVSARPSRLPPSLPMDTSYGTITKRQTIDTL